ncbi:alpha-2-macroglobulin domain protein [Olavius sp. associated proteobacterium Delta 1]|nr:alpha-2-macroglobulin domain protein [Olavius sp. associated proteobacterium Delta 1]
MKPTKYICLIIILALAAAANCWAGQAGHELIRKQAIQAYHDGNWKDAYLLYQQLCLEAANDPKLIGNDLLQAWQCLRNLNRLSELDTFREAVIAKHFNNWRLLRAAAASYSQNNHWGYTVAGEFHRGQHRGGGRYANAIQRDRVRALQLMTHALKLTAAEPARHEAAAFYLEYARIIIQYSGYQQAWRLQYLTDLSSLPDYESGHGYDYGRSTQGAPVDPEGRPVLHKIPTSFDAAKSDGERWRWLLVKAAELNPGLDSQVKFTFASFLHQQFGVQTLSAYSHYFAGSRAVSNEDSKKDESSPYEVHTLTDDETLARLANGVKRFDLPEEFNYIRLLNEIARNPNQGYANSALRMLAQIYENRRLYDRSVDYWISYKKYNASESRQHIDQITKNWGIFEPIGSQPSGRLPTVEYRFRNGTEVNFKAYHIRIDRLLDDVKSYIRSNPWRLDWNRVRIDDIGWRLIHENQTKYIGREAADWDLRLNPDKRHWDRRITVNLPRPLDQPGAYLLVGKIRNGNTARIIIWVSDTILVKKPLDKQVLYYAADAVKGKPLSDTKVKFFGYRTKRIKGTNRYQIFYHDFSRQTDKDGRIILAPSEMKNDYHWLALVRAGKRLAFIGFSSVWYPNYYDRQYNQMKTFIMTDRPVYRPKQKVRFKLWVRHAKYDQADASVYAGRSFSVRIHNPKNEQIFSRGIQADSHGGLDGEFDIPQDAPLGVYRISHGSGGVYGGNTFRVEEYKKPEFEVKVAAPEEPVMLGEKITAIIKAGYYFGSPVTEATVKYKVYRTEHDDRWYPTFYWDWFYGPGYWWYGYDYAWYPGWRLWGCRRPVFSWWQHWPQQPPEVVAEGEVKIGEDGTVRVEIDTELTKLIHGDKDHRYTISAEVRDQSRRTIVGQGKVLAARRPFKVYTWVDRGHYRVGDSIQAGFKAQTLDQKPVQGQGLLRLLRITYRDNAPQESEVGRWKLDTDPQGQTQIQLQASRAGQYRLSFQVTDLKNHTIEGGYVFTVRGEGDDGARYRFSKIELVPDKSEYAPGDRLRLQINTDRAGAAVVLFVRPANGIYLPPKVIRMTGKSTVAEISVTQKDMPNFFVEAVTVYDGKLYSEVREIIVPPEKRVLNVAINPSQNAYRPGQKANFKIKITDYNGEPFPGAAVMTVYDRALEYISGGSNVPEIRSFFWKWRRQHQSQTESSLARRFYNLLRKNEVPMGNIGVFGHIMFQDISDKEGGERDEAVAQESLRSNMAPAAAESRVAGKAGMMKKLKEDNFSGEKKAPAKRELAGEPAPAEDLVNPLVRTKFADTAFWSGTILTDSSGMAEVDFTMPENLTGWKAMVWSMGHGTKVGQGSVEVVTRKDLILRLQAPRFFVETDEVVLSANVHNYLKNKKTARVSLEFEGGCLALLNGENPIKSIVIDPNGEKRVDWRIGVVKEGEAVIRMQALTDEESDAVQMHFPVYVHGMTKQVPKSGVIRPEKTEAAVLFEVPAERRVDESRLELRFSPTLAGAMVDALPYLTSYPYGCTEQTLNRFLPTVITQHTLLKMGLDLRAIEEKRTNLNSQEIGDDAQRTKQWRRYDHNPVFDQEMVADMVRTGVKRLANMQLSDGGWGWFSGYGERSYPHTTAYVVHGLQIARANDAILPGGVLDRGLRWLQHYQNKQVERLHRYDLKKKDGKRQADNLDAFVYMVLVDENIDRKEMRDYLYRDRHQLAVYAKAMFGMALYEMQDSAKLAMILQNIEQYLVQDDENQTAYLNLPNQSYWWYWYGSEYEAHGYYLKLLSRTDPQSQKASRLVKYLLNNRKHATYWKSTRDTAVVVEAFAEYLTNSGEDRPDLTLDIYFDGIKRKTVRINAGNLFTFDNKLILEGADITSGPHTLKLKKTGQGSIYFNAYLDYFTLEDFITAEGLEIKVQRQVYRLKEADKKIKDVGSHGQVVDRRVEKFVRQPLQNLSAIKSGDLVEVELEIESKNDYEYLVFEDLKAAGFEPVEVRSGYNNNEMGAYVEYRDRKVCFFVQRLARGRHSISYRLRAETPGKFSALPTRGYAMYAPELKANSDEIKLIIKDN